MMRTATQIRVLTQTRSVSRYNSLSLSHTNTHTHTHTHTHTLSHTLRSNADEEREQVHLCCSVLQCVVVCCCADEEREQVHTLVEERHTHIHTYTRTSIHNTHFRRHGRETYTCGREACSVLQCVAVCCSVLQCVVVYCILL